MSGETAMRLLEKLSTDNESEKVNEMMMVCDN